MVCPLIVMVSLCTWPWCYDQHLLQLHKNVCINVPMSSPFEFLKKKLFKKINHFFNAYKKFDLYDLFTPL